MVGGVFQYLERGIERTTELSHKLLFFEPGCVISICLLLLTGVLSDIVGLENWRQWHRYSVHVGS